MKSVILCGGSGTRLWPLSRKNYPKQFLSLYSDKSLLQETFLRLKKVTAPENIFFITNEENFYNVFNQIKELHPLLKEENIIIEPASRNTLPAIAYSIKYLQKKIHTDPNEQILFVPADHSIANAEQFAKLIKKMEHDVGDFIGTIGITPTKPETGYGYIKKGQKHGPYFEVAEFKEKPDKETAEQYLTSKEYLWNSGMYMFSARTFNRALRKHMPEIADVFNQSFNKIAESFLEVLKISIDNGISEKSDKVIVFEGNFGWNDIGSFDSLAESSSQNTEYKPRHINIDSNNVFIHSTSNRLVATLGVDDLVIIENSDSILIHKKGRSEDVKKILQKMEEGKFPEVEHNIIVHRPWGRFEVLMDTPTYKVKKILVYPGAKLSTQSHEHRSEHWVVVSGTARALCGETYTTLEKNQSTFIPAQTKHRLENPGKTNLEIVEVQTGTYLGEDDIVRYDDIYHRAGK
jgi:mannose-1-phosphate guanylyltransferase/mannose-6-phosphate isomerase